MGIGLLLRRFLLPHLARAKAWQAAAVGVLLVAGGAVLYAFVHYGGIGLVVVGLLVIRTALARRRQGERPSAPADGGPEVAGEVTPVPANLPPTRDT